MTKLKNTKKGMAKKALSISLVAAMLATSNVPVWAAEDLFSDGSAAVEAPAVVEEPAAEVQAQAVEEVNSAESLSSTVTEGDVTVSLEIKDKNLVWGNTTSVTGTVTKKDGTALTWKYRWVDGNGNAVTAPGSEISTVDAMNINLTSGMAGKTLTLYVYNDTDTAKYDINTGIQVTVEKKEITKVDLISTPKSYNGFSQTVDPSTLTFTVMAGNDTVNRTDSNGNDNYTATATSAKNAGEKIKLTVTATSDSPYKGSVTVDAAEITKKTSTNASNDMVAGVEKGLSYQYTGNTITIDKSKVTLKETQSKDNGNDGKLSGADLSSAITKAEINGTVTPGDRTVNVYFDKTKLDNITPSGYTFVKTEETVKITKRDLSSSSTKISVTNGKIATGTTVAELKNSIIFKDASTGKELNLSTDDFELTAEDSTGKAVTVFENAGTYNLIIKSAGNNCTGEQEISAEAAGVVLIGVKFGKDYKPSYTGSAIQPTKDDLGTLTVTGYKTGAGEQQETLAADAWEITGYSNNTNAATYNNVTITGDDVYNVDNTKTCAYVNIKITKGTFEGKTYSIPFVIAPLKVTDADITVPDKVNYNKNYTKAEEYGLQVSVSARNANTGKVVKSLSSSDYKLEFKYEDETDGNKIDNKIKTTVVITNTNYIYGGTGTNNLKVEKTTKKTEIVAKQLTDSMIQVNPSSYTYTGGKIEPSYVVMDGAIVLYKKGDVADGLEEYEEVSITDAVNVGTGKITVKGINDGESGYSGQASAEFTITPANTSDVKVTIDDQDYTGKQVRPRDFTVTLNGNDVTDQFEIVSYGTNVEAGIGTVVLKPVDSTKNFTGSNITAEFNIVKEKIKATLTLRDAKGFDITDTWAVDDEKDITATLPTKTSKFDGNAKTFAKVVISDLKKIDATGSKTTATVDDLEIKYVDNISGKKTKESGRNVAYVYAVAKEGTGFAGAETITTADGTVIKGVVAKKAFVIEAVKFVAKNVSIKNGTYAAGLPVKPEILVQIGGSTLVEGKDYEVKLVEKNDSNKEVTPTDVTVGKVYGVKITGINGYEGSKVTSDTDNGLYWGIDKKSIADCNVTVTNGVVSVLNGYIPVPTTEYTSKDNGDGTYTVTANSTSKNYTGSKTVTAEGQAEDEAPAAPVIQAVKVSGNNATVVLAGESDGATGYDFVIDADRNCINNKEYYKVNKNILNTETTFTYTQQGTYYAYCHAWKRVDGEKVFSEWSAAYPFVVSSITPEQPAITKIEKSSNGKHLRVTWTKCANATGYDVIMGTKLQKVNNELRPTDYGKAVKKVTNGDTVSVIFYNIPKGTYYVGLHAYNRTSETGVKVFSTWSNSKKVTF